MKIDKIQEKLEQIFLVCHNEWSYLLWMIFLNFLLSAGSTISLSVMNALLFVNVGFTMLPNAFILSAFLMLPYFVFYNYLERKVCRRSILIYSFLLYSIVISAIAIFVVLNPKNVFSLLAGYVFSICILLLINLQYWSFASFIFHPRQGKRLFPLLGIGGTLGSILIGFSMKELIILFDSSVNLLYLWSVIFVASALVVYTMYKRLDLRIRPDVKDETIYVPTVFDDFKAIKKIPVLKNMAAIIFIMTFISMLLYFQFNLVIGENFRSTDNFAEVVAGFVGILNVSVLIFQLFFTGRVVSGLGLARSLLLHPAILFIPVLISAIFFNSHITIVSALFINFLILSTFFQTASESIYGAVPNILRDQAVGFMKIIITPFSIGLTGIVLVSALKASPMLAPIVINFIIPFIFVFWLVAVWRLKDNYIETLFGNFISSDAGRRLQSFRALSQLSGADALALMRRTLKYGNDSMRRFAVELAGEIEMKLIKDDIIEFLDSDNLELKSTTITALGKIGGSELYSKLMKNYKTYSRELKLTTLKSVKMISPNNFHINAPLLIEEETDRVIQAYLLEDIWAKGSLIMNQEDIMDSLVNSELTENRKAAAKCLRFDKKGNFKDTLLNLIMDEDYEVRREAVLSAGDLNLKEAIPNILAQLEIEGNHRLITASLQALMKIRVGVPEIIKQSLTFSEPVEVQKRKLLLLSMTSGVDDTSYLISLMDKANPEAVIGALEEIARNLPDYHKFNRSEIYVIEKMILKKVGEIRQELQAAHIINQKLENHPKFYEMLTILLEERLRFQKKFILIGLHLLYPTEKILLIMDNIFSGSVRKKNIALEALENLLSVNMKNIIIPLFEKETIEEEIEYIGEHAKAEKQSLSDLLGVFEKTGDQWLKAWALYTAGFANITGWRPVIEEAGKSKDRFISEHAIAGLAFNNGR